MEAIIATSLDVIPQIKLTYTNPLAYTERIKVSSAETAEKYFRLTWEQETMELCEQFKVMLLDHAHHILGIVTISSGSISQCLFDRRLVFAAALQANATNIILCHNHPSGNLRASEQDQTATRQLVNAGKLLDIRVLDHLIITTHGCISFQEELLFPG